MRISKMLIKVLSAAALLGGLCALRAKAIGADSPRPSAAASTSPVGPQGRSQSGATAPGKNQHEIASSSAIAVVGSPQATQPVAAWDVVPFQVFDKPFHVGVVAFHETGCKVAFTVCAAGTETAARTLVVENPTLNAQSNVWEFWFPLDPNTLPEGPVEVRAKVIPLGAGMIVRELAPLTLYANGHRSLSRIDCLLTSLSVGPKAQTAGVRYEALHVTGAKSPSGQGGSVGPVEFVDAAKRDFRPAPGSPAATGGVPLQCVPADLTGRPYDSKSPSRGCFQAVNGSQYPLTPHLAGPWWTIAGDPDLGALTSPKQQPVDFAIWQAADGTWQHPDHASGVDAGSLSDQHMAFRARRGVSA